MMLVSLNEKHPKFGESLRLGAVEIILFSSQVSSLWLDIVEIPTRFLITIRR